MMAFATVVCDQFVVLSCVLVMIIDLVTDILMCACVCVCVSTGENFMPKKKKKHTC